MENFSEQSNGTNMASVSTNHKRKSRFESVRNEDNESSILSNTSDEVKDPPFKKTNIDINAAALRAAEISKELSSKIAMVSSLLSNSSTLKVSTNATNIVDVDSRKAAAYRPLLLDSQGREIDEYGNLVKINLTQLKTLAANVAVAKAVQKKENPYLAHRSTFLAPVSSSSNNTFVDSSNGGGMNEPINDSTNIRSNHMVNDRNDLIDTEIIDERLTLNRRDIRGKKALHFVEPGKFIEEAEKIKLKEERKIIAGYSSGRKALQSSSGGTHGMDSDFEIVIHDNTDITIGISSEGATVKSDLINTVIPPYPDTVVPVMEWWDEVFLPKERRDARKISKAAANEIDDISLLAIQNARTYKLVQHPIPVKPLGGERNNLVLPMYLTKQERKKLRRTTRYERELEKRDKMMMGLLPAPEPKFKLSNFMKVLGDQAVADPSKVEIKVLQQMQQRVLNHERRNQANKLTAQQRKEKKLRKLTEDTSRAVHVAVFCVRDFSNLKHRFKVDVNAQQHFLSGIVLLCTEEIGKNLVVVEGGPKGIRKFVRLMTNRIKWSEISSDSTAYSQPAVVVFDKDNNNQFNYLNNSHIENSDIGGQILHDDDDDSDSDSDDNNSEGNDEVSDYPLSQVNDNTTTAKNTICLTSDRMQTITSNRCDLLWQGIIPKRIFTGFKFQESKTQIAARKLLKSKGVNHYWDMVENADNLIASSAPPSLF